MRGPAAGGGARPLRDSDARCRPPLLSAPKSSQAGRWGARRRAMKGGRVGLVRHIGMLLVWRGADGQVLCHKVGGASSVSLEHEEGAVS